MVAQDEGSVYFGQYTGLKSNREDLFLQTFSSETIKNTVGGAIKI